jgi:hypothetical protein
MQTNPQHLPPLAEYQDLKTAQETLGHFPTLDSLRWFIRRNRDQLAESGALIMVAGRQKLHPGLAEVVVKEAGRQAALGGGEA